MDDRKMVLTSIDIGFWDLTKFLINLYFASLLAAIIVSPVIFLIFFFGSALFVRFTQY